MKRLIVVAMLVTVTTLGFTVAPASAKPPKKCAELVETAEELSALLRDYFDALDLWFSSPEGSPEEAAASAAMDGLEKDLRSFERLFSRDLKRCKS
jgi:hypothetical protein